MGKGLGSFAALALVLAAVSLLVLQPICEAREPGVHEQTGEHASGPGDAKSHLCCSIGEAALLQGAIGAEKPDLAIPKATIGSLDFRSQYLVGALASAVLLPVLRYHVRSKRILS